ncbi:MAG: DEAD/DEAH box helicase [Treponema sp.]|jgi:ATP-dependent RNA helicase RhlB|nr:DEAD/DEAH box helicase [Treponema sp.]
MEFSEFNLHPDLQRGITGAGYITCMPVQEQVLANAFGGQDLYVQSQTGTGKTAAFLVVIFQRLLTEPLLGGKKAIIMVPTRELAVQVEEEAKVLGKYLPFKVGSFYGGVGYGLQQRLLQDNVQILVGTPGRVLDLNKSGYMNLMDIAFLILDEADRMFDMGFYPDLRKLIKVVPPADRRQTMLFSATLNTWVKNLAWEYTKSPYEIEIEPETVTVEEVEQVLYHVSSGDKMRLLLGILNRDKPESAIIFCNTKRYAEIVAKRLRINGIDCEFIIGDLPQAKRLKIIEDVKAGLTRFLVATDVAARGLDIEGLAMVVNYDLPVESENYVHRIGRTARAGKTGKAITLASEQDVYELPDIEKYIGKKISSQIAGEDLYGEDKSAGLRIKTGFYDDAGPESRDGRGGGSGDRRGRSGGRDRGESRWDRGRRNERGGGHGPARDKDRREEKRRRPLESGFRENAAGLNREDAPEKPEGFSRLSLEERLAYYKEKYDQETGGRRRDNSPAREIPGKEGPGRGASTKGTERRTPETERGPAKRRGGGKRRPRERDEARSGTPAAGTAEKRESRSSPAEASPGPRTGTGGKKPETGAKPGVEKPALLGKLLGLFKKKD